MAASEKLNIRKAGLYDVPSIARIERNTSRTPWSADSLTRDIMDSDRAYVAAAELVRYTDEPFDPAGAEVIGYADMWVVAGEAQLNNIAIEEAFRGRSYGERLLDHMISRARDLGCDTMTLEVRAGNTAARSLYEKCGFVQNGIRPKYYRDNKEDAVLMSRNILLSVVEIVSETRQETLPDIQMECAAQDKRSGDKVTGNDEISFDIDIE